MDALTSTRGSQDQIARSASRHRRPDRRGTLGSDELQRMDAYWRVVNDLSVGQIYLYENPLLSELRFTQISFRSGTSSHIARTTPGSIHEGDEPGYSLSDAWGLASICRWPLGAGSASSGMSRPSSSNSSSAL